MWCDKKLLFSNMSEPTNPEIKQISDCLYDYRQRCRGYNVPTTALYLEDLRKILSTKESILIFISDAKIHFANSKTHAICTDKRTYCVFSYFTGRTCAFFDTLHAIISQLDNYEQIINWYTFCDFDTVFPIAEFTIAEKIAYLQFKVSDSLSMDEIISRERTAIIDGDKVLKELNGALRHIYLHVFNPNTGLAFQYLRVRGFTIPHGNTGFCTGYNGIQQVCPYAQFKGYTIAQFQEAFDKEYSKYGEFNIEQVKRDYYMKHIHRVCNQGPEL